MPDWEIRDWLHRTESQIYSMEKDIKETKEKIIELSEKLDEIFGNNSSNSGRSVIHIDASSRSYKR